MTVRGLGLDHRLTEYQKYLRLLRNETSDSWQSTSTCYRKRLCYTTDQNVNACAVSNNIAAMQVVYGH